MGNKEASLVTIDPTEEIALMDKPAFGLRETLRAWGIRCHDILVYDADERNFDIFSGDYSLRTYSKNSKHSIVNSLREGGYSVQSNRLRPIESIPTTDSEFISMELIYSSRTSWGVTSWSNRKFPPEKNSLLDIDGPLPVITISERSNETKKTEFSSRIIVIGTSTILSNKKLKNSSGNRILSSKIIYWLTQKQNMMDIEPKKIPLYNLTLNKPESRKFDVCPFSSTNNDCTYWIICRLVEKRIVMKNIKKILVLGNIGVFILIYITMNKSDQSNSNDQILLDNIYNIQEFSINKNDQNISFKKSNNEWDIELPFYWKANELAISKFIAIFSHLKLEKLLSIEEIQQRGELLKDYGIDINSTNFSIKNTKFTTKLLIGKKTRDKKFYFATFENNGIQSENLWRISTEIEEISNMTINDWIQEELINQNIYSIEELTVIYKLAKNKFSETTLKKLDGEWQFIKPFTRANDRKSKNSI